MAHNYLQGDQRPIFRTLFQRKITFRGKFRGISKKNDFSKLFHGKFHFFPTFLGAKFSAEFSQKFSPEKCTKNWPQMSLWKNGPKRTPTHFLQIMFA
jgi:hypothetical protein